MRKMQGDSTLQVLQLLGKPVGQACKPAHGHAHAVHLVADVMRERVERGDALSAGNGASQ
jgi:hypothetical protein